MKVSSALLAVVVLTLIFSLISIWLYPSVQGFTASNTLWNGIRTFSSEFNAGTIESLNNLPTLPEETILVVIPYLDYSNEELTRIKQLVDDGGTLALLDDYGYGNSILTYLGVRTRFTNVPLLDPLFNYKNQSMPRIVEFAPEVKESGIDVIVLNHATTLTDVEPAEMIAWSSTASFLDINENGSWDEYEPKGPFPVAAELRLGQGRLILLSDPSIMINAMLGRDDNYGFIEYLTGPKGKQGEIQIDNSHLSNTPLDISKMRLIGAREMLSSPYALLGITALIFIVASRYILRKGETID